jgi:NAD(P)H-nitrite reductase large subunit
MHHLIIGAGPAAVTAAEHLRKLDAGCRITLLAAEGVPPYSRMALPYFLVGDIEPEGCYLRKRDGHFESQRIDLVYGRASSLDTAAKRVTLLGGDTLDYDKLLIATGSTATRPPIDGIDLDKVYNCWSLADAHRIIENTGEGSRVVLMGAGFIGCIILEALANRQVDLTVIEMEERMVSRMTNAPMGDMIKGWCESKGIRVMTSTQVTSLAESAGAIKVSTAGGDTLDADVVICATGVRANTHWLDGSGINVDAGIVVDDCMATNAADVYAAGDVAQGRDLSTGDYEVQAIQPTAVEHGKLAARNMINGNRTPRAGTINMNVLDTVGLISTSFGLWMGVDGGQTAEFSRPDRFEYLNLQFKGDVLVGASSLGMTQHVGVMRGLIQTGAPLGKWKDILLAEPNRISEAYLASAQSQHAALVAA